MSRDVPKENNDSKDGTLRHVHHSVPRWPVQIFDWELQEGNECEGREGRSRVGVGGGRIKPCPTFLQAKLTDDEGT